MPVSGHWLDFPVTPAFVSWRLASPTGAVIYRRVAADFRFREPVKRNFWSVYAAGTYQNFPDFTHHFYWHVPGRYLFNLTPSALDTRKLRNGTYRITVVAADTCGNRSTLTERIVVNNARAARRLAARAATTLPVVHSQFRCNCLEGRPPTRGCRPLAAYARVG